MPDSEKPLTRVPLDALSLDEDSRPIAPVLENITDDQRRMGRHLAAIHRMHLRELAQARAVLRHVADGKTDPSAFLEALRDLDLTQNMRLFGTLCGQECRMLTFHHDAEEQHVFPTLEEKGPDGLRAVVAKLRAEHLVVHELLARLEEAAIALEKTPEPTTFAAAAAIFDKLDQVVQSHFGYEETEIGDSLGVYMTGF